MNGTINPRECLSLEMWTILDSNFLKKATQLRAMAENDKLKAYSRGHLGIIGLKKINIYQLKSLSDVLLVFLLKGTGTLCSYEGKDAFHQYMPPAQASPTPIQTLSLIRYLDIIIIGRMFPAIDRTNPSSADHERIAHCI